MREEITEPLHWRASSQRTAGRNQSWSTRRRSQAQAELAAEAVDAALADDADEKSKTEQLDGSEIISSLASQLDLLERQREQLQKLLEQAKSS